MVKTYGELIADGSLAGDVRASILRVFAGFFIASAIAVPLALVLAYSRILRGLVMPLIALIRPIPPIAWIPLASCGWGWATAELLHHLHRRLLPHLPQRLCCGTSLQQEHVNAARSLGRAARCVAGDGDASLSAPDDRHWPAHRPRTGMDGGRHGQNSSLPSRGSAT